MLRCRPGRALRRTGRTGLVVPFIGVDDAADEGMAYHVRGAQMHERNVVDAAEHAFDCGQSRRGAAKSTWVMSPVTTIFVLNPNRVKNIFICCAVVFCASSRITYASLSVRPRM